MPRYLLLKISPHCTIIIELLLAPRNCWRNSDDVNCGLHATTRELCAPRAPAFSERKRILHVNLSIISAVSTSGAALSVYLVLCCSSSCEVPHDTNGFYKIRKAFLQDTRGCVDLRRTRTVRFKFCATLCGKYQCTRRPATLQTSRCRSSLNSGRSFLSPVGNDNLRFGNEASA